MSVLVHISDKYKHKQKTGKWMLKLRQKNEKITKLRHRGL
jgi:hypothetical protein